VNKLEVPFRSIKGAPNIIFIDNDGDVITEEQFEEDLKTGYRAGIILIPVSNAVQLQVAMNTPYHKDHYEIDPGFIVENYNNYLDKQNASDVKLVSGEDEFYIGEVIYE
jgi:hypothetical protein